MKTKNIILGLDISTSCCGFSILNNGELVYCKAIVLNKVHTKNKIKYPDYKDVFDKALAIEKELLYIKDNFNITAVVIEAPLLNKAGSTSKYTIALLHKFNGIVAFTCIKIFDFKPIFADASRSRAFFKIPKLSKIEIKQLNNKNKKQYYNKIKVMEFLKDLYPSFEIEYNKKGNILNTCLDRSDSLLISYIYYIRIVINKDDSIVLNPPLKKRKKKK